ncbi:protein HIGH CHLOROPHYLL FLUORESCENCE PHENOTYPE 173, chloroplastic isoform X4 [Macadamia integrifolia]|uniref:protein HIGH CHLOROPHYLL FLUORESCENCE PHENOTYPE 173, chloroplastic isoform X4 n=1 Tax=Macadamia integrifolia TaxID=60698 RepID=UPI001C5299F5|nr:protein HIGH CHLOROPHYLL FLUORESCENCE PHENOTYPE 173, chloroplastic isoform X4 [Macadamia integrifolia]
MTAATSAPSSPSALCGKRYNHSEDQKWSCRPAISVSISRSSKFLGLPLPNQPNSHSPRERQRKRNARWCVHRDKRTPWVLLPRAEEKEKEQKRKKKEEEGVSITLDDVNPVGLGRRSRQIFDEVWRKFSGLGQISRTRTDESLDIREGPMCEFTIPGAQNTTVLVVGATSRIGRIVVRKLMLRGYNVKALVRKAGQEVIDMLPRSVDIVIGDVGERSTLKAAVEGCNKIIYCATARSTITGDLNRVDHQGVYNVTKAFQDYNNKLAQLRAGKSSKTKLLLAKFKSAESLEGWEVRQGTYFEDVVASKYDGGMDAKFEFTESGNAVFSEMKQDLRSFKMILEYIKALPTGQETDFILVSCTGLGIESSRREQALKAKKAGEDSLRRSGLGYTIVRPGPLKEEPGGQRALIFDQGNRISQGISCADVADICVKALHDSTARNKSFDVVCYEYVAEQGKELYELVAHLPDKANNYLTPALSVLEKNT